MINNHLSESEIQQYSFERDTCNNIILEHVSKCEPCRIQASNYKIIDEKLKDVKKEFFNFDLSKMVLKQISADTSSSKLLINLFFSFLFGFMAVIVIGAASYFIIDAISLKEQLANLPNPVIPVMSVCVVVLISVYTSEMFSRHRKLMRLINTL